VDADDGDDRDGPEYDIDFREHPEAYEVGRGEEGAFKGEPFEAYRPNDDFVGMEMARISIPVV
jgi:hypothetical protein